MTLTSCGAGNAYPSGAHDFTSGFHRGSCRPVICVSLFHVIVLSFDCSLFDCLVSIFFVIFLQKKNKLFSQYIIKRWNWDSIIY